MHSRCANYWVYSNCRPQHVNNPQKNESFFHPVCTDTYKQSQGMENPSNLYNYIPTQNNFPRPCQKVLNEPYRVANSQSIWTPSAYPQTFRSAQKTTQHQKEPFPGQTNNICHMPQPLPNHNISHVPNSTVNFTPGQSLKYTNSLNTQSIGNSKAHTPRIKVKDVYSLNNDAPQGLILTSVTQSNPKKQDYYSQNSSVPKQRQIYNREREFINYDSIPLVDTSHSYQQYASSGRRPPHVTSNQQYIQPSSAFFEQNAQFACDTQLHYSSVKQMQEKPPNKNLNERNYPPTMSLSNISQESSIRRTQMDSSDNHKKNSFELSISNNSGNAPFSRAVANTNNFYPLHQSESGLIQPPTRLSPISPADPITSINPISEPPNNLLHSQTTSQNFNEIRMVIPHSGQNGFLSLENSSCGEPRRQERPPTGTGMPPVPEVCQRNESSNLSSMLMPEQFEPLLSEGNRSCENPPEGMSEGQSGSEAICAEDPVLDCFLTPKLEKDQEGESFVAEEEVCAGEVVEKMIKKERAEQEEEGIMVPKEIDERIGPTDTETKVSGTEDAGKKGMGSEPEGNGEERKYTSKINRNKLNMLINFLKKDDPILERRKRREKPNSETFKLKREDGLKQRKRKLKNPIEKNNNETEKMSKKSQKFEIRNRLERIEPEEVRESGSSDNSNFSENTTRKILKAELGVVEDDDSGSSEIKWKGKSSGKALGSLQKTAGKRSSAEKLDTAEERQIINIMRALQNLKSHFCANCDVSLPVESVWINVVSGELRCLHCFKKMLSKAEEAVGKANKSDAEGEKSSESFEKKEEDERGEKGEESVEMKEKWESPVGLNGILGTESGGEGSMDSVECLKGEGSEPLGRLENGNESRGEGERRKGSLREEEKKVRAKEESVGGKLSRSSSWSKSSPESSDGPVKKNGVGRPRSKTDENIKKEKNPTKKMKEELDFGKKQIPDEQGKAELKNKTEKWKSSNGKEQKVEGYEKHRKKEGNSPDEHRKRSLSLVEFVPQKVRVVEEGGKDGKLWKVGSQEKCFYKGGLKEGFQWSESRGEEVGMKEKNVESVMFVGQYVREDKKVEGKGEEGKRRVSWSNEEVTGKFKRKRLSLDEKKADTETIREVKFSSEKLKVRRDSKESHRIRSENGKEEETGKVRKEESRELKVCEKLAKKEAELTVLLDKLKKKNSSSQKTTSPEVSRRLITSKEEGRARKKSDDSDCLKSQSMKDTKAKGSESSERENVKTGKAERKERHWYHKTGRSPHEKDSSGKDAFRKFLEGLSKEVENQSRPFKENQNTKICVNGNHGMSKKQELKKRDDGRSEKSPEDDLRCCQPKSRKNAEDGSERKKVEDGEGTERKKQEKIRRESPVGTQERKDKATEGHFGKLMKDMPKNGKTDSGALLAKLMKKTKKLSWSLLGETLETEETEKEINP